MPLPTETLRITLQAMNAEAERFKAAMREHCYAIEAIQGQLPHGALNSVENASFFDAWVDNMMGDSGVPAPDYTRVSAAGFIHTLSPINELIEEIEEAGEYQQGECWMEAGKYRDVA